MYKFTHCKVISGFYKNGHASFHGIALDQKGRYIVTCVHGGTSGTMQLELEDGSRMPLTSLSLDTYLDMEGVPQGATVILGICHPKQVESRFCRFANFTRKYIILHNDFEDVCSTVTFCYSDGTVDLYKYTKEEVLKHFGTKGYVTYTDVSSLKEYKE